MRRPLLPLVPLALVAGILACGTPSPHAGQQEPTVPPRGDAPAEPADGEEEEAPIAASAVPPAVREAAAGLAGGHAIASWELEGGEDDEASYEATWTLEGREHEAVFTAAGALLGLEEVIEREAVPAAVRATADRTFPGEKTTFHRKMIVVWEVEAGVAPGSHEILVSPNGATWDDDDED